MVSFIVFSMGLLYSSYEHHTGTKGINGYQWVALMIRRSVILSVLIVLALNVVIGLDMMSVVR